MADRSGASQNAPRPQRSATTTASAFGDAFEYLLSVLGEYERPIKMVNHKAMALNCMLYRANRLAPLAMNLHGFCTHLGTSLGPLLSEYAFLYPTTNVHFFWNVIGSANSYASS